MIKITLIVPYKELIDLTVKIFEEHNHFIVMTNTNWIRY